MIILQQIWQNFWATIENDDAQNIEGYIWQKPNGSWIMLAGNPEQPGDVNIIGGIHYNPFTGEKLKELALLMCTNINLQFTGPQSIQEMDAMDYFKSLLPEKRTKLLGEMYTQYAVWYNDQQKELARVGGW